MLERAKVNDNIKNGEERPQVSYPTISTTCSQSGPPIHHRPRPAPRESCQKGL